MVPETSKYLDVSVHDLVFVEILQAFQDLPGVELDGGLLHRPPFGPQKSRKASWKWTQQRTHQHDEGSIIRARETKQGDISHPTSAITPTSLPRAVFPPLLPAPRRVSCAAREGTAEGG